MPFNATEDLPWNQALHNWSPFRIDALGLVTLLGAEEINRSLGRLVPSRYLEFFPLLGAFVIAGQRFKDKIPAFSLYNFTDGINTTELSFWLARWMTEQELEVSRSVIHFEIPEHPRRFREWYLVSGVLAFVFVGFLTALTVLIGDWYGFANALAMIISIFARAYIMQVHRNAIDDTVAVAAAKAKADPNNRQLSDMKKCVVVLPDSKAVTIFLPGKLIIPVFVYNPEPAHPWLYLFVRMIAWAVFAVHIVTIGMATLLPQIYTVALMVIPTVLICFKFGCDDSKWPITWNRRILGRTNYPLEYECWIGSRLKAYVSEWPTDVEFEFRKDHDYPEGRWVRQPEGKIMLPDERSKRRQDLFAWLNLSEAEEESLAKWDLLPHARDASKTWWVTYQAKKALISGYPIDISRKDTPIVRTRSIIPKSEEVVIRGSGSISAPGEIGGPPRRTNTWLTSSGFIAESSVSPPAVSTSVAAIAPGPIYTSPTDVEDVSDTAWATRRHRTSHEEARKPHWDDEKKDLDSDYS